MIVCVGLVVTDVFESKSSGCASCISIMTPMAAPCQIMIIESGDYTFKDYLKCGTPLALILAVITIFLMPMMFPFY